MTGRRVVVTGIGTINPLGNSIEEYFSNLEKGVSGAAPITHFDAEKFKTKFACEVKNYDPTQYFDRKEVRKYDLFTQYALIAATWRILPSISRRSTRSRWALSGVRASEESNLSSMSVWAGPPGMEPRGLARFLFPA